MPDDEQTRDAVRADGGGARTPIEQRDLAEEVTAVELRDVVATAVEDADVAVEHDEELVTDAPLLGEDLVQPDFDLVGQLTQSLELPLVHAREERNPAKVFELLVTCHWAEFTESSKGSIGRLGLRPGILMPHAVPSTEPVIRPPPETPGDPPPLVPGLPSDRRRWLVEVIQVVVISALLYAIVTGFVAAPYRVELGSMQPGLLPGDHLLVDQLTPRWNPYERGDIVVFDPPPPHDADEIPFVKRVIGVAGDTVRIENGRIWVTASGGVPTPLDEPYLADGPTLPQGDGARDAWEVADGEVFLLGDNRGASVDSRTFGPVAVARVIGRAWLRYLPLSRVEFVRPGD